MFERSDTRLGLVEKITEQVLHALELNHMLLQGPSQEPEPVVAPTTARPQRVGVLPVARVPRSALPVDEHRQAVRSAEENVLGLQVAVCEDGRVASHDRRKHAVSVERAPARRQFRVKRDVASVEGVVEVVFGLKRSAGERCGAQEDVVVGLRTELAVVALGGDLAKRVEGGFQLLSHAHATVLAEDIPERLESLASHVLHDDEVVSGVLVVKSGV